MTTAMLERKTRVLKRVCAVCGKALVIKVPVSRRYSGGHYFGKFPISTKAEWAKALKAGTHVSRIGKFKMNVMNRDPKPYKHVEYWECEKCYRGK